MAEDERAKRLAAEVRASTQSTVLDLAACGGAGPIKQLVEGGFAQPLPLGHMVRLSFIVGGGKKVRQRYDDKLPQILSEALKGIGFAEDRGASCTLDCQGLFKYQHDTDKDLKFIHVFPRLDPSKAGGGSADADADGGSMSPAELLLFSELDTFEAMIRSKTPSFAQRRRALEALKRARVRVAEAEAALTAMRPLSEAEQEWYDAVDAELLSRKIEWLTSTLEQMISDGQLTSSERAEVVTRLGEKLAEVEQKRAAAEAAGKSKAAAQLAQAREELTQKLAHVRSIQCITLRPKYASEMNAARKRLAELEKLEKSKVVLPLEEVQKLSAKPKLLADLKAMEADSAGWFSEPDK